MKVTFPLCLPLRFPYDFGFSSFSIMFFIVPLLEFIDYLKFWAWFILLTLEHSQPVPLVILLLPHLSPSLQYCNYMCIRHFTVSCLSYTATLLSSYFNLEFFCHIFQDTISLFFQSIYIKLNVPLFLNYQYSIQLLSLFKCFPVFC